MPPWCPKRAIGEGLSTDYEMDNFKIVKQCYLTPFIYTAICDFGAILLSYVLKDTDDDYSSNPLFGNLSLVRFLTEEYSS